MKRIIAVVLLCILLLSLTGCGALKLLLLATTGIGAEDYVPLAWWEYKPYYPGMEGDDWRELKADTHVLMDTYGIGVYIEGSIYGPDEENSEGEVMFTGENYARQCYEYDRAAAEESNRTGADARYDYKDYVYLAVTDDFSYLEIDVGGIMVEILPEEVRKELTEATQEALLTAEKDEDACLAAYRDYLEMLKPWLEQGAKAVSYD